MERLTQDLRFGIRMLLRQWGFTAVALLMLALGIGSNVVVFSLAQTMYFKTLDVPGADRLVGVNGTMSGRTENFPLSLAEFTYIHDHARTLSISAAHYQSAPINLVDGGDSREITGGVVTASYFPLLQITPAIGRFFTDAEDTVAGRDAVVVISYELWRRQFGGDAGVLGRSLTLNGAPFTIIGVAPAGFAGVSGGSLAIDAWMPRAMARVGYRYCNALTDAGCRIFRVVARLAPGATPQEASAEITRLWSQYTAAYPAGNGGLGIATYPIQGAVRDLHPDEARVPILLAAAVAAVLLITCANLAGLHLARGSARAREIGIRLALGASRGILVRQLLTEGLLLAAGGGALGLLFAFWTKDLLSAFYRSSSEGQLTNFTLDINGPAVAFTIGVSLLALVMFGLAPALLATRRDVIPSLKHGVSVTTRARLRGALVIVQVAGSIVLLVGATLLARSMANIYRGPGFDPDGVLLLRLRPSLVAHSAGRAANFQHEVISRLARMPGVVAASPALYPPLPAWGPRLAVWLLGQAPAPGQAPFMTPMNAVGPDYLHTLQLPLIEGRDFSDGDRPETQHVAIVNEVLARRLWPSGGAIGSVLSAGDPGFVERREFRVIGVMRAAGYHNAASAPQPMLLLDYWQMDTVGKAPIDSRTHVRVNGDARAMLQQVRRQILAIDPSVPISEDRPLNDWLANSFRPVRATAAAMTFFAALALLLSVIGLYAAVAASVARRTRELAVRIALGANRADVGALVLKQGLALVAGGVAAGVAVAMAAARVLSSYLYGVTPNDPAALAAATAILAVTALAASCFPARRAMRLDPIQALRNE